MNILNNVVHLTQAEFDALPTTRTSTTLTPDKLHWELNPWKLSLQSREIPSTTNPIRVITTEDKTVICVHEGEPAPCRASGCDCFVGDEIIKSYPYKIVPETQTIQEFQPMLGPVSLIFTLALRCLHCGITPDKLPAGTSMYEHEKTCDSRSSPLGTK